MCILQWAWFHLLKVTLCPSSCISVVALLSAVVGLLCERGMMVLRVGLCRHINMGDTVKNNEAAFDSPTGNVGTKQGHQLLAMLFFDVCGKHGMCGQYPV